VYRIFDSAWTQRTDGVSSRPDEGSAQTDSRRTGFALQVAELKIDPETAAVDWIYAQTLDPYGVYTDLPEECWQVGREYFARSPGSDIWVWFGDLPEATRDALWEKHKRKLAFPARLEELFRK
jgi:hypothetical protein